MHQIRSSKKTKMSRFSFCFPYLASLPSMPIQNAIKQKISFKLKRYDQVKMRPKTATSRFSSTSKTRDISNFEINKKKRGQSLDLQKKQKIENYSKVKLKTRKSMQIQHHFTPFTVPQMPQFDFNEVINKRTNVRKQQEKKLVIDNFQTVLSKKFEIPGVSFKKTQPDLMKQRYSSIQSTSNQSSQLRNPRLIQHSTTRKINLKWTEQRMLNIQYIIKNKCKDFQGTMAEYYQRAQYQKASFIFVFDSKDLWMKRVLINRGWSENKNKHSKAFHLMWTYKYPMDTTFFPEQLLNHYRFSLKMTTKIGLHSMLKKYKLLDLQPQTFDLDKEKDNFISFYDKISFLKDLKEIHQNFNFIEKIQEIVEEKQLKQRIRCFLQLPIQNPEQEYIQRQLKYFLQQTLEILIQNKKFHYKSLGFTELVRIIKLRQQIQTHFMDLIILLKQSYLFIEKENLISNFKQGGKQNIWIVKSHCSSKGAGMFLSNDLMTISKQGNRLAQKYIENILLLQGFKQRKFDLRIWILVMGGKKFKIYYNQQFYGRLCFQAYTLDEKSLKNNQVHLTNYSVNRPSYKEIKQTPHSVIFPEQLFEQIYREYKINYKPIFYQKVQQLLFKMQEIFEKQVCIGANQNTFQLFGVDLLLDYKLDLHLLQINLSAQCEERHEKLTKRLQRMGQGLLNILQGKEDTTTWRLIK